jgi:hypothetical protein
MKKRVLLPVSLALLTTLGTACFGQFAATRMVYRWNGGITNSKFVHTLVLYAFIILPVYSIAGALDFFILNVIEFWTGNNLLAANLEESDQRLAKATITPSEDGGLHIQKGEHSFRLVPLDEKRVALYRDDALLGITELEADGSFTMYDREGRVLRSVSAEEVAEVAHHQDALMQDALAAR